MQPHQALRGAFDILDAMVWGGILGLFSVAIGIIGGAIHAGYRRNTLHTD